MQPSSTKFFSIFFALIALGTACGIDKKPHYGDKTFGRSTTPSELPVQGGTPSDEPTDQVDPGTEEPDPPLDQILGHYGFNGYFNMNTVRRITRGTDGTNGEISQGGFYDEMLSSFLSLIIGEPSKETLSMQVRQDGNVQNIVTQEVETVGGDNLANFKGDESQSGTQLLDWSLPTPEKSSTTCPQAFVCIDRMVWVPVRGKTMTYCYRDPQTKKPISIPYSPNSQFGADSIAEAIGSGKQSDPIEVTIHPGNINCDDEEVEVRDRRLVMYELTQGNLADQRQDGFLRKAIHRKLDADIEVVIEFKLFHPTLKQPYLPKKGPFIDQLTRLNSKTKFYLNSTEHVIVKLERTVQSPLDIGGNGTEKTFLGASGDLLTSLIQLLFPKDGDTVGAQLVYSFEFCTHLDVIRNPFNHCTGKTNPTFLIPSSK